MSRARIILTGGVIVLAAGALAMAGALWTRPQPVASTASPLTTATAEITRGALRDTKTVTGTLGYGDLVTLRPDLNGASAMVTWLAPEGATVSRGEPLYRLDGVPTLLLYGTIPQHRTLRFDANGASPIWVELEQARAALDSAELTLDLEQQRLADAESRAADARNRLADALSRIPATPEFVQLTGAVSAAEAKLERVHDLAVAQLTPTAEIAGAESALAAARSALDSAIRALRKDASSAALDAINAKVAIVAAAVTRDEQLSALQSLQTRMDDDSDIAQIAANLTALGFTGPLAERIREWQQASGLPATGFISPDQIVVTDGPVHIASRGASAGTRLSAASPDGGALLSYTSTDKLVTVPLQVADQALAAVGRSVVVTLPDDTSIDGTISEIGSVVSDGAVIVTVDIPDQGDVGTLEVASVEVEFVSDSRDDVLSVPIAALLARPEGGFAVELVGAGQSQLLPVKTGLFAAGRVEITGDGINEGMRVGMPG